MYEHNATKQFSGPQDAYWVPVPDPAHPPVKDPIPSESPIDDPDSPEPDDPEPAPTAPAVDDPGGPHSMPPVEEPPDRAHLPTQYGAGSMVLSSVGSEPRPTCKRCTRHRRSP